MTRQNVLLGELCRLLPTRLIQENIITRDQLCAHFEGLLQLRFYHFFIAYYSDELILFG
jgi:hypothetical protein